MNSATGGKPTSPETAGKREKGVDVLCALAAVREAQDPDTDLVILASSDSDLALRSTRWSDYVRPRSRLRPGTTR